MGVWEYENEELISRSRTKISTYIFLIIVINFSVQVPHSHTPILPYSHTLLGFLRLRRHIR
jgi:hypothetical protein